MIVGIFSDTHLGFMGEDRFDEAFLRFNEAVSIFQKNKVDVVLHAGDLFDDATPTQEVWLKTFNVFASNFGELKSFTKNTLSGKKQCFSKGIPFVAIHGTHEHRGKDFANAIDVLEESNCLVHIHASNVEFNQNGERVVIHGLGGVPEKHAKEVLEKYNPRPISGATNIIMFHQSFKEFLPFDDDDMIASLSLSDLPQGFDLIVNGHLHWSGEQNVEGRRFLLTGSTIFTQMKKLEGEKEKGVFIFDTVSKNISFVPFQNQRKLFYQKFSFKEALPEDVIKKVNEYVSSLGLNNFNSKPLVRIKLVGTIAKGFSQSDVSLSLPKDLAVFSLSKEFTVESFQKKLSALKELALEKKSVLEMGVDLLEKNVVEAGLVDFDTRRMFELLALGENEKAQSVLLSSEKN